MGTMISAEDKKFFRKIESISGCDIAVIYNIHYSGDSDPITYGGFFYNIEDWEKYGYAEAVDFWYDDDNDRLVVQNVTINKPTSDDRWKSIWSCYGYGSEKEICNDVHAQIEAVKACEGEEPVALDYPDTRYYDLNTWKEWRVWRSVSDMLNQLTPVGFK